MKKIEVIDLYGDNRSFIKCRICSGHRWLELKQVRE
jgi:hypothetical protein